MKRGFHVWMAEANRHSVTYDSDRSVMDAYEMLLAVFFIGMWLIVSVAFGFAYLNTFLRIEKLW
jgi:nitrate reductase NapE component